MASRKFKAAAGLFVVSMLTPSCSDDQKLAQKTEQTKSSSEVQTNVNEGSLALDPFKPELFLGKLRISLRRLSPPDEKVGNS